MIRRFAFAAALVVMACSPPQAAQTPAADGPAPTQPATVGPPADAAATITAWYRQRLGATLIEPVEVFYGDFSGDGVVDALAWGYFNTDGNMTEHVLALFRSEGGQMVFVRTQDDVQGSEPRDVRITPGGITLTTKVSLPTDPGCCPTGAQEWTIEPNLRVSRVPG